MEEGFGLFDLVQAVGCDGQAVGESAGEAGLGGLVPSGQVELAADGADVLFGELGLL